MDFIKDFIAAFIPLFVAIDALATVPVFISLVSDLELKDRKQLLRDATLTAFIISVLFLFGGKFLFQALGITSDDFRIGGGIVLLLIAIADLLSTQHREKRKMPVNKEIGIVPLGIPLIVGPASLTTILILGDRHGYLITLSSLIVNLLLAYIFLSNSNLVIRVIGNGGARAFAKVASLILVAIAIMMIRIGITNSFGLGH